MAEVAGMSRSSFAETFTRALGTTPATYLGAWRIDVACTDLRGGSAVGLVTDRLGYSGAAAFSRAFRKRRGGLVARSTAHGRIRSALNLPRRCWSSAR